MTLALTDERLRELEQWATRYNSTIGDDVAAIAAVVGEVK